MKEKYQKLNKNKEENEIENEENDDDEEEEINDKDEKKCEICLDNTIYDDNIILTCSKCNINVHQSCYSIDYLPSDEWCCDVCEVGKDPELITCSICSHNGSALKRTELNDKWIHVLCGIWIPDVYVDSNNVYNISKISPVRYKLGCKLCHKKGAIIQCAYGRCAVSAHPWCAVKMNLGFAHRIVKNPDHHPPLLWEIFCKNHASAVSDPVKPKVKAKRAITVNLEDDYQQANQQNGTHRKKKGGKTNKNNNEKKKKSSLEDPISLHSDDESYTNIHVVEDNNNNIHNNIVTDDNDDDNDFVLPSNSNTSKKINKLNKNNDNKNYFSSSKSDKSDTVKRRGRPPIHSKISVDDDISRLALNHYGTPKGKNRKSSVSDNDSEWSQVSSVIKGKKKKSKRITSIPSDDDDDDGDGNNDDEYENENDSDEKDDNESEKDDNDNNYGKSYIKNKKKSKKLKNKNKLNNNNNFAVHTFSEWPGQSEGEPMDLPYIWNVISMMYPEDYSVEWIDFMLSAFKNNSSNPILFEGNGHGQSLLTIPPLGSLEMTLQKLQAGYEEIINASSITERDFISLMDPDKRREFEHKLEKHIEILQKFTKQSPELTKLESTTIPDNYFLPSQKSAIISNVYDSSKYMISKQTSNLNIVFNGCQEKPIRIGAEYCIRVQLSNDINNNNMELDEENLLWRKVKLDNIDTIKSSKDTSLQLFQQYGIISPSIKLSDNNENNINNESNNSNNNNNNKFIAEYALSDFQFINSSQSIKLPDCDIISYEEESDEICTLMRRDISSLQRIVNTIANSVEYFQNLPKFKEVYKIIEKRKIAEKENENLIKSYYNQRTWGYICRGLQRGIKDQPPDFNQAKLASIPASWSIKVDGRPDSGGDENETQTDTICMCCFDGITSEEYNKIIFCDGCNSSLHQMCYGVHTIPEGDYFCDRCKYIQNLHIDEDNYRRDDLKDIVTCCLCNTYHGGLKQTIDGRWVHMCCVFWAQNSLILKLEDISKIDISNIPIYTQNDSKISSRKSRKSISSSSLSTILNDDSNNNNSIIDGVVDNNNNNHTTTTNNNNHIVCTFCGQKNGYLTKCCYSTSNNDIIDNKLNFECKKYFHPLCSWFAGSYVETSLTDPTFLGTLSDGLYPSGIEYKFYCLIHTPSHISSPIRQIEQQSIRLKYKIDEADLCVFPGKTMKKKKHRKKNQNNSNNNTLNDNNNSQRISNNINKIKDLNIDIYPDSICAICMEPTHRMLPLLNTSIPSTISCHTCHITIHTGCIQKYIPSISSTSSTITTTTTSQLLYEEWNCDRCIFLANQRNELKLLNEEKLDENEKEYIIEEIKCALCPRRGGAFYQRNLDKKWVHYYCETFRPINRNNTILHNNINNNNNNNDNDQENSLISLSKDKKQICIYCNRKNGICVKCCNSDGCSTVFHPLCASRSGDSYLHIHNNIKVQYCKRHIPETVYKLPNGYWVDLVEISNLRKSLDSARLILDLIKTREKYKKKLYLDQVSTIQSKLNHSMIKLKKKFGIISNNSNNENEIDKLSHDGSFHSDNNNSDDCNEDEDGIDDDINIDINNFEYEINDDNIQEYSKLSKSLRRRGSNKIDKINNNNDNSDEDQEDENDLNDLNDDDNTNNDNSNNQRKIMTSKRRRNSLTEEKNTDFVEKYKINKSKFHNVSLGGIDFSGQLIKSELIDSFINRSSDEYYRYIKDKLLKTVAETRGTIGMFESQRAFSLFHKTLHNSLQNLNEKPLLEIVKSCNGTTEDINYAKQYLKKRKITKILDMEKERRDSLNNTFDNKTPNRKRKLESINEIIDVEKDLENDDNQPIMKNRLISPKFDIQRKKQYESEKKFLEILDISSKKYQTINPLTEGFDRFFQLHIPYQPDKILFETLPSSLSSSSSTTKPSLLASSLYSSQQHQEKDKDNEQEEKEKQEKHWSDWIKIKTCYNDENPEKLIQLERQIYHILKCITDCVLPIKSDIVPNIVDIKSCQKCFDELKKCITKKRGFCYTGWWNYNNDFIENESSKRNEIRYLIEGFEDIPGIENSITIDIIKYRLQCHQYISFSSFANDFYEMLNNARSISPSNSKLFWDSYLLGELFEYLREVVCLSNQIILFKSPNNKISVDKCMNKKVKSNQQIRHCSLCSEKYLLTGYASNSDSNWKWNCPTCNNILKLSIFGYQIKVYWIDDKKYYDGWIEAYDELSGEHRVRYSDDEWEFIKINEEDYYINYDIDDKLKFEEILQEKKE